MSTHITGIRVLPFSFQDEVFFLVAYLKKWETVELLGAARDNIYAELANCNCIVGCRWFFGDSLFIVIKI